MKYAIVNLAQLVLCECYVLNGSHSHDVMKMIFIFTGLNHYVHTLVQRSA